MVKISAKHLLLVCFFYCLAVCLHAQTTPADPRLKDLDTLVARALKTFNAPGCAVAVVHKQKVIFAKGYGYKDWATKTPVDANTLFAIGSCTKAFTATLIGMLAQEGKFAIDDPVTRILPALQFKDASLNQSVTLRDMMCHRTGLPRHDMAWVSNNTTPRDSLLYRIRFFEASAGLRERWQYNNFMYLAQGVVAEKVTGKSWEENIREKILVPLGMQQTSMTIAGLKKGDNIALPYKFYNEDSTVRLTGYLDLDNMGPAGSINSSVTDMTRWLMTWMNGGRYADKTIIPAAHHTAAITPQMTVGGLPDPKNPDVFFNEYGFGWSMASYKGHYRVEHGGNVTGYSASVCFMPTDSIGVVVLSNQDGSVIPSLVRNSVLDRLLGVVKTDWTGRMKASRDKAAEAAKLKAASDSAAVKYFPPVHPVSQLTGTYTNDGYGSLVVSLIKDTLRILYNGNLYKLKHKTCDLYSATGDEAITDGEAFPVLFRYNTDGEIKELALQNLEPAVKELVFTKKLTTIAVSKDALAAFAGEYELSGAPIKLYVKGGQTLYMLVPGQPEYELAATGKDEFKFAAVEGFGLRFNRNAAGEIESFLLKQPQGNYTVKKK
jgi:CubicO group peptidase (beta-lactamase class C family)